MSYDDAYFQNQINKSDAKVEWQYGTLLAFAQMNGRQPLRVLDAGCGVGPGLRYLDTRGYVSFGCDLVEYPLRVARQLAPSARLTQSNLNQGLPFADNSFDVILLSEVIEHLAAAQPVLRECWRVLDMRGAVVLTTPNLWDVRRPLYALVGRVWSGDADPTHTELFNPQTLARNLSDAGFAKVTVCAGFKPLAWLASRLFHFRFALPYPPLIGNTLIARGYKITNSQSL